MMIFQIIPFYFLGPQRHLSSRNLVKRWSLAKSEENAKPLESSNHQFESSKLGKSKHNKALTKESCQAR